RLLYGYMFAQPCKKLLFMGDEFGQVREWAHDTSLEWHVLQYSVHSGVQKWVEQLNRVYREQPALHELDNDPAGFEWVDCNDTAASVVSLLRKGRSPREFTSSPVSRNGERARFPLEAEQEFDSGKDFLDGSAFRKQEVDVVAYVVQKRKAP